MSIAGTEPSSGIFNQGKKFENWKMQKTKKPKWMV